MPPSPVSLQRPALSAALVAAVWAVFNPATAQEVAQSRIAIVGKPHIAMVGQDGYCGWMKSYSEEEAMDILVTGGKRTWVRTGRHIYRTKCIGDFSFVPEPTKAYIVRFTDLGGMCSFELFQVHRGAAPTRQAFTREESRSCLLPWNHQGAASSAEPTTP
jgi:hypothetical protein